MDFKEKIRSFMLDEFKEAGFTESIGNDDSLVDSSILDSLSILKLISFMDDEFDIFPEEGELSPDKIDTITQIAEYVGKKLNN